MTQAPDRSSWPVRITPLKDAGEGSMPKSTPEERLAAMWPLALDAWATMGKPIPAYARSESPVRVVPLHDA